MFKQSLALWLASLLSVLAISLPNLFPLAASAQFAPSQQTGLSTIGSTVYTQTDAPKDIRLIIGSGLKTILGLVGFILVILMIIAGLQYMTAAGNKTKLDAAIARIKNAFIGLIIILVAYAATAFIIAQLVAATTGA